jgi:hypothetical protein
MAFLDFVFNELSLQPKQTKDIAAGQRWLDTLLETLQKAQAIHCPQKQLTIYCQPNPKAWEVMQGYTFEAWLSDSPKDKRVLLVALLLRRQKNYDEQFMADYQGQVAIGLAHAYEQKTLALSLASGPVWQNQTLIPIHLDEQTPVNVPHVSQSEHLSSYARPYAPTPKHRKGGHGTTMPLADAEAQNLLRCGVQMDDDQQIYAYHAQQFYVFQPDNTGSYHGYPLTVQELGPKRKAILEALRAKNLLSPAEYQAFIH